MKSAKIEELKRQYEDIVAILKESGRLDLWIAANESYAKSLLMSAASYFEHEVIEILRAYFSHHSSGNVRLDSFVWKMALNRKFYSLFDFGANNVNGFFSLFGEEVKNSWRKYSDENNLGDAIKDFLSICNDRNKIVHQNYAAYQLEDSFDKLFPRYENACKFLEALKEMFKVHP